MVVFFSSPGSTRSALIANEYALCTGSSGDAIKKVELTALGTLVDSDKVKSRFSYKVRAFIETFMPGVS